MSDTNLYLVPEDALLVRHVSRQVLAYLKKEKVIGVWLDRPRDRYAPGTKAARLVPFEFLFVYEGVEARFVPDSHAGEFGSRCPRCRTNLDDPLYDALEAQAEALEAGQPFHAEETAVTCARCGVVVPLVAVKSQIPTAVTRFYIQLGQAGSLDVKQPMLAVLAKIVGSPLRVVAEML